MTRRQALEKLQTRLNQRRDDLRRQLNRGFDSAHRARTEGSDLGDLAFAGEVREMESRLASNESRELRQIEFALLKFRDGRYGECELCETQIPVGRLDAVPYTPVCVTCQRSLEESGRSVDQAMDSWEQAIDFEGRLSDRDVNLRDLESD